MGYNEVQKLVFNIPALMHTCLKKKMLCTWNCPHCFIDLVRIFCDVINNDITFNKMFIHLLFRIILQYKIFKIDEQGMSIFRFSSSEKDLKNWKKAKKREKINTDETGHVLRWWALSRNLVYVNSCPSLFLWLHSILPLVEQLPNLRWQLMQHLLPHLLFPPVMPPQDIVIRTETKHI